MGKRVAFNAAVFILVQNDAGEVLLHQRQNTPFMNGRYDMPSGHVESGEPLQEAAARELFEEVGLTAEPKDLKLWHINQFFANGQEYCNFFFRATKWTGEPKICEPHKCSDLQFFDLAHLPLMTVGTFTALKHVGDEEIAIAMIDQAAYDAIAAMS